MSWLENTMACAVTRHSWGNAAGVDAGDIADFSVDLSEQAQAKRLALRKKLIVCPEYEAILSGDRALDKWMRQHSVPSMLKGGIYAVPTAFLGTWERAMLTAQRDREQLVGPFLDVYYSAVGRAGDELGRLFRYNDYPSTDEVAGRFSMEVRYVELGVPARLQTINAEVYQQAQARLQVVVEEGQAQIEQLLVQEVSTLVQGLQDALTGLDGAQPKRFYRSHLEKIVEWTQIFRDIRNVTGFDALEAVTARLQATVAGQSVEAIKSFDVVRRELQQELTTTAATLQGLMEVKPSRRMRLTPAMVQGEGEGPAMAMVGGEEVPECSLF